MFCQDSWRRKTKTNISPVCTTKRPDDELESILFHEVFITNISHIFRENGDSEAVEVVINICNSKEWGSQWQQEEFAAKALQNGTELSLNSGLLIWKIHTA